jgi:hypothetical protein
MSDTVPATVRFAMPRSTWTAARRSEQVCLLVAVALVLAGVFHLGVFAVRGGPWEGPVSWRKPFTFGVSFGLTLIAVVWVTSYVRVSPRLRGSPGCVRR